MCLQVRRPGLKTQSINHPYPWEKANAFKAVERIKVIARASDDGQMDLGAGALTAEVARTDHDLDWDAAITAFREGPKARIAEQTGKLKYVPVLNAAMRALHAKRAPSNGHDFCDVALKQWAPGQRHRQIMRQNLSVLLRFCVERRKFKACWRPPTSVEGEALNEKRIGYPLTDAQILRLIDSMPDTDAGRRWRLRCS